MAACPEKRAQEGGREQRGEPRTAGSCTGHADRVNVLTGKALMQPEKLLSRNDSKWRRK